MLDSPAVAQRKCFDVLPTHLQLIRDCSQLLYCSSFRDVSFICSDGTVQANRAFLAARSEYFRGLLFGGLQESSLATVALSQVKAGPLRLVLHYLHTLDIKSTGETPLSLAMLPPEHIVENYELNTFSLPAFLLAGNVLTLCLVR